MSGPIPAGPKAVVWSQENRFSSKDKTKAVPLKGLSDDAKAMCGEYVCVTETNKKGRELFCPAQGKDALPGDGCFAQKFAYYTLDRFIRLLADKLVCDIADVKGKEGCEQSLNMVQISEAIKNRKMPLPVVVNSPSLVNAYYSPSDVGLVFGDGEGKFLLATDGDIIVHEAGHWLIDTINPTLGSSWIGLGNAIHEGSADAIAALHFGDPQMAEDFNIYKTGRGYKGGLRSVKNTRTVSNLTSMEPHESGKMISGFWWSLYERIDGLLKKQNPDEYKKNPANFGQMARNATLKLVLAHVGSYSVPSPDAPDFLEAVVRGATDLNFIDALPELKKNNVTLMALLKEIKAEGKARGFDVPIWPMRSSKRFHADSGAKFGATMTITGAAGEKYAFKPQVYQTKFGQALVVGHGVIDRYGATDARGLRKFAEGEVDETVDITREKAYETALATVGNELAALLASRTGEAEIPAASRKKMLGSARKAIQSSFSSGNSRLAILPGETGLVWLFDAGVADIAVDAKTGKAKLKLKGFVD